MKAKCFECEIELPEIGKSMEELIEMRLPVFCNPNCAFIFPNNGTKEFDERLKQIKEK